MLPVRLCGLNQKTHESHGNGRLGVATGHTESRFAVIDGVKYPVGTMHGMPKGGEGLRFNYVSFRDDNVRVDHKWTDGRQRYSVTRNPDARREVENALAKDADGRYTGAANADIVFSDALPPALVACGIPDGRVYTRGYVLRKLEREHELDADGIMAVARAMERPSAVLADAAETGYVILTDHEARDRNGRMAPVMVYLRPDGRGNYIASAYAKTENGERQYTNLINAGKLLYADRVRVAGLSLTGEVKSSFESASTGDADSIPYGGADSQGGESRHSVTRDWDYTPSDPQREYDEVVARYTNPDGTRKPGWMKAPNGRPTNLEERQWVQVRTPAFRAWFGDWEGDPANASKVVDENGEPLVVYHGTNATEDAETWNARTRTYDVEHRKFTVFRRDAAGGRNAGHFFSDSADIAGSMGGEVYAVHLAMRSPLVVDVQGRTWGAIPFWGGLKEADEVAAYAEAHGHDGLILRNVRDGAGVGEMERTATDYVVFDSRQIKSATDNTGEFGPGADIRYSVMRGATEGVREALRHIADGEDHGVIHNAEYGDIEYPLGRTGRRGMGLAHIVESRMGKDGATLDEAIDVAIKVASAAESGRTTTERYNTKHLDKDGVRAIVAFMPDGSRIITGYEISADGRGGANRRSPKPESRPHVSLEGIVAALKSKLAIPPTPDIVAQSAPEAQAPTPDAFVRDAVMGMLAAAGDGNGAEGADAKPTERASVRRGGSPVRIDDLAVGTLAQRILAGKDPTVDDARRFLDGFGLSRTLDAGAALRAAREIAETNRERLKGEVERANPEVIGTLARANLSREMRSAMDSLVTGAARAVDPEVGMRLKDAVASRDRRALMAAKGFTAAEEARRRDDSERRMAERRDGEDADGGDYI